MSWWDLLVLSVALGTDAFSLGIGVGLQGISWPQIHRSSGIIGLFHVLMPLAGLVLGQVFGQVAGTVGKTGGALLLVVLGLKMIWEGITRRSKAQGAISVEGWGIVALAFSVSIDSLLVGFSLGTLGANLLVAVILFGISGGVMAAIGFISGKKAGRYLVGYAGIMGGLVLFFLGIRFMLQS